MAIGQPISTVAVEELGGTGCNYDEDITSLQEGESPNSIDIEFDETVVRKRPGYRAFTTAIGSGIVGRALTNFANDNGVQKLVAHQGQTVFSLDNLAGAQTSIRTGASNVNSFFTEVKRFLIHTFNDHSTEYYWDGSTALMQVLSPSAPGFKHAIESQGFLLGGNTAAEPLRIYYEDTNSMIGGSYADFFTLSGGRDDQITGFFILNGRTYATTKTGIFRLSFVGGVTVFEFKNVVDTAGAVPRTAKTVVTDEFGEVVLFLGFDLSVYMFDGSFVRVISDKYRKPNNDTPFALELIDRSRIENSNAVFDPLRRVYRLFTTKKGGDENRFAANIDVRNLSYYPYQNMQFHSTTIAEDAVGRLFLVGSDYDGQIHKLFTEVNDDNGVVIVENYEAPPMSKSLERYKKAQTVDLLFTPTGDSEVTYEDRTDFDITWRNRDTIHMHSSRDRFLGQNTVLGTTAKLASDDAVLSPHVNIPVTNNIYRFRLHTGGTDGDICRTTVGTVAGAGGGTSLTGTGTPWTSDMTSANGWKIWIDDGSHKNFVYDFDYISATTATVSTMTGTSPADDFTGASYELYQTGNSACAKRWELLKIDFNLRAGTIGKGSKSR
jgi:hypothetical protein